MFQRDKTGCLQSMANNHHEVLQDWMSKVLQSRTVLSCWDNEGQRTVKPCRMHTMSL